jgi:hypothetical protein
MDNLPKSRARFLTSLTALVGFVLCLPVRAGTFQWLLGQLSTGKASLVLADRETTVQLKGGWTCVVSAPSGGAGYEARTTTCRKGSERVLFVVQCDANNPKDHAQIQFGDKSEADYIEVLCEPRKIVLRPNTSFERTREG